MNYSNIKSQVPQDPDSYKTTIELLMGKACLRVKDDEETLSHGPVHSEVTRPISEAIIRIPISTGHCRGIMTILAPLHTFSQPICKMENNYFYSLVILASQRYFRWQF